jgi:hypothetical protein
LHFSVFLKCAINLKGTKIRSNPFNPTILLAE